MSHYIVPLEQFVHMGSHPEGRNEFGANSGGMEELIFFLCLKLMEIASPAPFLEEAAFPAWPWWVKLHAVVCPCPHKHQADYCSALRLACHLPLLFLITALIRINGHI